MITEILKPQSAREAVKAKSSPGSAYLGGGTWLNSGSAPAVTRLVSLERLGLSTMECDRGRCVIGATVTLQQIVDSGQAPRALRAAAALVASRTLRNMKTLGGAIAMRSPDSAILAVLVALRAEVSIAGRRSPLTVEAYLASRAEPLVLSVIIPDAERPCALRALSRTSHAPRSLVVAVSVGAASAGAEDPVIVVSDCVRPLQRLAITPGSEIEKRVSEAFEPVEDPHASKAYKRYLAGIYVADCLSDLSVAGARP